MTAAQPPPPAAAGPVLLPPDRFFVRAIPLVPEAAVGPQVELALESLSPFPVTHVYYGCVVAPDRSSALVFAAYRKRFTAEETAAWNDAPAVLPAFLALLGDAPSAPTLRVWHDAHCLTALAWNGRGPLPVAFLSREIEGEPDAAQVSALADELRTRTGLGGAAVQECDGPVGVAFDRARGTLRLEVKGAPALQLSPAQLEAADVRDKEFLAGRRALQRRDLLLWRGFQACLGGLAALLVLELAVFGGGFWLRGLKQVLGEQAPAVKRIETAQALSARIEEMTERRLMPFEMLAVINQNRPASIQFTRSSTTGLYTLEIEAQTSNAADVGQYESVLRASPDLAGVETRDLRSREGVTSFVLAVTFKPAALHPEAGT
jgi:hypothetical protein